MVCGAYHYQYLFGELRFFWKNNHSVRYFRWKRIWKNCSGTFSQLSGGSYSGRKTAQRKSFCPDIKAVGREPLKVFGKLNVTVQDGGYLLARLWPDKKHRMSIRCENEGKNMLISKLNACFCPHFPAVLNCSWNKASPPMEGMSGTVRSTYSKPPRWPAPSGWR